MFDYEVFRLIWWVIISILLIGFTLTDGFDMGVGILSPFIGESDSDHRIMINSISPHWEGNQVWLVAAGAALFAAWPMVYAAAFSGFYTAMILALSFLLLRPLAFDYRSKIQSAKWRKLCDWCLCFGSFVPALVFGVAFGNLLQGVPFKFDTILRVSYEGGFLGLLNPFALLTSVVSVSLMVTHGGAWLQMKTDSKIYKRARKVTQIFSLITMVAFILAGVWVVFGLSGYTIVSHLDHNAISDPLRKTVQTGGSWLTNYRAYPLLWAVPLLGAIFPLFTLFFSSSNKNGWAFFSSSMTIVFVLMTFGVTLFPFIMPSSIMPNASLTIWDGTSSHNTLRIMTCVVAVALPTMLLYTSWCYAKTFGRINKAYIKDNNHSLY